MKKMKAITLCGGMLTSVVGRVACAGIVAGMIVTTCAQEGTLDIQGAVLLTWPESPLQAVMEATAATGPWTICPRPIHRAPEQLQLAVPATGASRFFKLCPGAQVIEDFTDGNLSQWHKEYKSTGENDFSTTFPSGALRVSGVTGAGSSMSIAPAPAWLPQNALAQDFIASVDILDWGEASTEKVMLFARVGPPPTYDGYEVVAGVTFNETRWGAGGQDQLWLWYRHSGGEVLVGQWTFDGNRAKGYRLVFKGQETKITSELYELSNLSSPVRVLQGTTPVVSGAVGLAFTDDLGTSASQPFDITVDNLCFTVTWP